MKTEPFQLPRNFVWGAASAAYQVEGGWDADGKGPSVWDTLCRKPGAIYGGNTGDVACDHYHLYKEDVAMMAGLGIQAYRFSISWSRVLPAGDGPINHAGLDFYDRLVDGLLAHKIQPWLTLFHWDYPQALYDKGGWLNGDSPKWFADYTRIIDDRLSDRVTHWMTLNEPQCFVDLGHRQGVHAPGVKLPWDQLLKIAHNVLLSHGLAVQQIRAHAKSAPTVGFAFVGHTSIPASDSTADVAAARHAMFSVREKNFFNNTWWADPIFLGHYPEDGLQLFGKDMPVIPDTDFKTIQQPVDFYGLNIYNGETVRAGADGHPEPVPYPPGFPHTLMGWPVTPEALYWGPRLFHERYGVPIVMTENGMSNPDWVALDGAVHDPQRIDFLTRYLREYLRAAADGVPLHGYFAWSIMDNFEWAEGYKQRFGIVHVDYQTLKRTSKDSAHWYARLIRTNAESLPV